MIAFLRGALVERCTTGEILIEVAGVGYRVLVPASAWAILPPVGEQVLIHTYQHVREDALSLYGFCSRDERLCFEVLLGAHGVGPSLALSIIAALGPNELRSAVAQDDVDALCAVPGVGKKTAARLLLELKERLEVIDLEMTDLATGQAVRAKDSQGSVGSTKGEVREALASLGYASEEIREATRALSDDLDASEMLSAALSNLAPA